MSRLIFKKQGNAVWISHLDLMRLFQRAFKRAGLMLKHTQGFNPRPSVSIALPLSVGVESRCELLEFELEGAVVPCDDIKDRLNAALVEGVSVVEVYDEGRKFRDLALLECIVTMKYDEGVPMDAVDRIRTLFGLPSLIVPKKTKNGVQEQDIIPMIRRLDVTCVDANTIELRSLICCQNPTLNPAQLVFAIEMNLGTLAPSFSRCSRIEIYDEKETVFR